MYPSCAGQWSRNSCLSRRLHMDPGIVQYYLLRPILLNYYLYYLSLAQLCLAVRPFMYLSCVWLLKNLSSVCLIIVTIVSFFLLDIKVYFKVLCPDFVNLAFDEEHPSS